MKVSEAIELLKLMPQDATLVGTDGPIQQTDNPASARLTGIKIAEPVLDGFSAEEVKREEWDLFLLPQHDIVVLAMLTNSRGRAVG